LRIATLKHRTDFQQVRKGARWAMPAFVLEARRRSIEDCPQCPDRPRFGFTVTKQVGNAVERNRIRRRLKAAVRNVQMVNAKDDFDYALIARRSALDAPFHVLVADLVRALERVHRPRAPGQRLSGSQRVAGGKKPAE
jgi:ribonuclease P protein component